MQAMILAAGFGTRLEPYSLVKPKPLFPVLNRPLLLATIERLRNCGCTEIIVNCHHLGEQVVDAASGLDGVRIQQETEILGTGGGLGLASRSLAPEPLLVTNGDIYHNADLVSLYEYHQNSGNRATLLLHDEPRFNTVRAEAGIITGFNTKQDGPGEYAYTGIQVIDPDLLHPLAPGSYSCIIQYYRKLIAKGEKIGCWLAEGLQWLDIGTPEDYLALHEDLLAERIDIWPELHAKADSGLCIDAEADCRPDCRFVDWASVGKASIGAGSVVERSVVWDGAWIADGQCVSDSIVIPTQNDREEV